MLNAFSRTELLLGSAAMKRLAEARVAVFGIGGVGGYVVEALARAGIGALDLIDNDVISLTNLNRQIIATSENIGNFKVDEAERRVHAIHPQCRVEKSKCFYLPDTAPLFDFTQYDYIVDAIDTVTGKLALIENAKKANVPIISSMGTGNKLDPTALRVADIYKTSVDPLARVIRKECRKRGIRNLKVVYSQEEPLFPTDETGGRIHDAKEGSVSRRDIPGSVSFVPSAAGLIIAGEVIKDLTGIRGNNG